MNDTATPGGAPPDERAPIPTPDLITALDARRALGACVRRARNARGWLQRDLADAVGVTLRTIGSWERQGPPPGEIAKLERALGPDVFRAAMVQEEVSYAFAAHPTVLDEILSRLNALELAQAQR